MSRIFRTARASLASELERFRNRHFLEACMAASALVAMADGEVNFSELATIDQVLETVQQLRIYDPHTAVNIYRDYIDHLREDEKEARRQAFQAVERLAGDEDGARLVIRVCVAIGKADDDFNAPEKEMILDLCATLAIPPTEFELS